MSLKFFDHSNGNIVEHILPLLNFKELLKLFFLVEIWNNYFSSIWVVVKIILIPFMIRDCSWQ